MNGGIAMACAAMRTPVREQRRPQLRVVQQTPALDEARRLRRLRAWADEFRRLVESGEMGRAIGKALAELNAGGMR